MLYNIASCKEECTHSRFSLQTNLLSGDSFRLACRIEAKHGKNVTTVDVNTLLKKKYLFT
jgi:hypothetical protein